MPIYAYKCSHCGHAQDVLQRLSDAPLTICPSCNAGTFAKQITAAGFQLKGTGWYATDFRSNGAAKAADKSGENAAQSKSEKPAEGKAADSGVAKSDAPPAGGAAAGGPAPAA